MTLLLTRRFYQTMGSSNPYLYEASASNLHVGFSQEATGFAGFAIISCGQKYELRDKKPEHYSKLMKINGLRKGFLSVSYHPFIEETVKRLPIPPTM